MEIARRWFLVRIGWGSFCMALRAHHQEQVLRSICVYELARAHEVWAAKTYPRLQTNGIIEYARAIDKLACGNGTLAD